MAAKDPAVKYSLGSVLNHVLLHQTVNGQEAIKQFEMAGDDPDVGHRLHRRRLEFRRSRVPVPRPAAARRAQAPLRRGRAGGVPVADARQIRLRLRRHRASDAARQDAHARLDLHSAGLPCRRPALSRHGADGVAHLRTRPDRGARLSAERPASTPACSSRAARASCRRRKRRTRCAAPSTRRCAASREGKAETILFNLSGHGHFDMARLYRLFRGQARRPELRRGRTRHGARRPAERRGVNLSCEAQASSALSCPRRRTIQYSLRLAVSPCRAQFRGRRTGSSAFADDDGKML